MDDLFNSRVNSFEEKCDRYDQRVWLAVRICSIVLIFTAAVYLVNFYFWGDFWDILLNVIETIGCILLIYAILATSQAAFITRSCAFVGVTFIWIRFFPLCHKFPTFISGYKDLYQLMGIMGVIRPRDADLWLFAPIPLLIMLTMLLLVEVATFGFRGDVKRKGKWGQPTK